LTYSQTAAWNKKKIRDTEVYIPCQCFNMSKGTSQLYLTRASPTSFHMMGGPKHHGYI
jgi:hypothetical protein